MERSYFYTILITILGGTIGSFFFGLLDDIYRRKKLIVFLLFIITLGLSFILILSLIVESIYDYYQHEYDRIYNSTNQKNFKVLSSIYFQEHLSKYFEKNIQHI